MPTATKRFHFDLFHLGDDAPDLTLHVGQNKYAVEPHTTETRAAAVQDNKALALIPPSHHHRITHFVDVSHEHLPSDRLCRLKVTYDHGDANLQLPVLVHASFHIPEEYRAAHRQQKFAKQASPQLPPKLQKYGVEPDALVGQDNGKSATPILKAGSSPNAAASLDPAANAPGPGTNAQHLQIVNDLDKFVTPKEAAEFIVFHHPALGSRDPYTATRITDDHINAPENHQALQALAVAIERSGRRSWTTIQRVTTPDKVPMTYEVKLGNRKVGDPVQHYVLVPNVLAALPAALKQPLKSAADDPALQDKKWSVTQGMTAEHKTNLATAQSGEAPLVRAAAQSEFKWTLANQNASHGLSVYSDSIEFSPDAKNDGSGTFRIKAKNTFLRTLGAYVEFIDEGGNVITDPEGWNSQLPAGLRRLETSAKKYICIIPPVNNIMGIPCPTDPTRLSFSWPSNATGARLLFGGLGNREDWDGDVCVPGVILTGIVQYGIPVMFLAAETGDEDTSWFSNFVAEPENVAILLAVAFPIVGGGVATAAALGNTKQVLFMFADVVAGILVKKGLEALLEHVTEEIAENDAAEAVPFAGWALMALLVGAGIAQIAETTGEVISSPATLRYDVARAFEMNVTVKPDPDHGEAGKPETAVWPAVSDNYEVTVQYERGTNFVKIGSMPKTTSNAAISLNFPSLPAGGRLQINASIYSESGWLCGKWTSGWIKAVPTDGNTLTVPPGTITEQLVPLTADSQYAYKEKIIYDATQQKHIWQDGTPPTATFMSLSSTNTAPALSKLVNMTIFNRTFEIGYSWQAASQGLPMVGETTVNPGQAYAFRKLSVLADPESRLKFPNRSFRAQPLIIYDQFGEPRDAALDSKPHQFFLEPLNEQYQLRQITLDDDKSVIDLTIPLPSWGQIPLTTVDAAVINNGKVIAASWTDHKLAILQIPATSSADADAPTASLVSGEGVRQGLLRGPIAMAVTIDGRLLVMETVNQRVQAFDLCGNPVPCFDGAKLFSVAAAGSSADLDRQTFPDALQTAFQQNNASHLFDLDADFVSDLNQSKLSDELLKAFGLAGVFLSVSSTDPNSNTTITPVTAAHQWRVEDKGKNRIYTIAGAPGATSLGVYTVLNNLAVMARTAGQRWIINDRNGSVSYDIQASRDQAGMLDVFQYLSFMPLQNPTPGATVTFLDLATEARGYIYVLCFTGDGSHTTDYFLDIYEPNGAFLCRTPDSRYTTNPQNVVAARLVIDPWRNAFTLNYEATTGPNNSTEPSIGHWMPMPPLFPLDLSNQPSFDSADVGAVRSIFSSQHKPITLGDGATITTISTAGHWKVTDGASVYDVIRSGDKLQVYKLPARARRI
jgi:hypothetical protein